MADDFNIATVDGTKLLRVIDVGGKLMQALFVAPMRQTPVGPPERLSVTTGGVATLSPPGTATHATIAVENNPVRWYADGTAPTTGANGNGPTLAAGDYLELDLASFANFKMIGLSATAIVHVYYWRYA